jgi:hypothetical protein
MREMTGDLWTVPADVRVVTTNGVVNAKGVAVMGRGCALEAKSRYPGIEYELGRLLNRGGNHVHLVRGKTLVDAALVSFPVKHAWFEIADLKLISRSVDELIALVDQYSEWKLVVLPRPGCGNGKLDWSVVSPVVSRLDDRFFVITNSL